MSDVPDLGQIRPLEPLPPDEPDNQTTEEAQEIKRRGPTATEREAASHQAHIETYRTLVEYHCTEKQTLKTEIITIRQDLDGSRQRERAWAVRCERLESTGWMVGCLNLFGIVLAIIGPLILAYGGSVPNFSDASKIGWCAAGGAITICGVIALIVTFVAGYWNKPPKPPSGA
jgi:hypothetical protein